MVRPLHRSQFIEYVAHRKVDKLSYASFQTLQEHFDEKLGLTLFDKTQQVLVIEAIETRNISNHNNCIINHRYCQRTGTPLEKIGKIRELFLQDAEDIITVLTIIL